jgi:hypothetical protein
LQGTDDDSRTLAPTQVEVEVMAYRPQSHSCKTSRIKAQARRLAVTDGRHAVGVIELLASGEADGAL